MEEAAEKHDMEIKIYKQKVKHLMYDHHSHLAELKVDTTLTFDHFETVLLLICYKRHVYIEKL